MPNLVLVLLALFSALRDSNPSGCKVAGEHEHTAWSSGCAVAKSADHTHWSHMNDVLKYPEPVTSLHGVVLAAGGGDTSVEGVLVEVFDHPEIVLESRGDQTRKGQKRLAACITGKDGRFSLGSKPGKYELRFSKQDWNVQSVIVEVSKKASKKTPMKVLIEAAT